MKHPGSRSHDHATSTEQASPTLDAMCRESLEDLKNGRLESLDAYIDMLTVRLKGMRAR